LFYPSPGAAGEKDFLAAAPFKKGVFFMKGLCLYHDHCADGFAAALAVWLVYGDSFEYLPVRYGEEPPEILNRDVIIVDFSYPRKTLERMKIASSEILVIDHHQTAEDDLKGLDYCIFDNSKSGAVLAWEHFHPAMQVPDLFKYVQDRDLWKWELPNSREINASLRILKKDFKVWKDACFNDAYFKTLASEGFAIVKYQDSCIESVVNRADIKIIELGGYDVPIINVTHLVSETVGALAKFYPFAVGYYDLPDRRYFSLRSRQKTGVNVAEIAKQYGGGGHANAAGFSILLPPVFPNNKK
jgi:oligoribonuclease NrnB/cAMP/cGMP phosphodiesterase (DHH superfamily)